jgi:hypothetical protein
MLNGKELKVINGPILIAQGITPFDPYRECLVRHHGDDAIGPERGWTITMHKDAQLELEFLTRCFSKPITGSAIPLQQINSNQ